MTNAQRMRNWVSMGGFMGTIMFIMTIVNQYKRNFNYVLRILASFCPTGLRSRLQLYNTRLATQFYPYINISIHEFPRSHQLVRSRTYALVEAYLSGFSWKTAKNLNAELEYGSNLVISMGDPEKVRDEYRGVEVWWYKYTKRTDNNMSSSEVVERRYYRLNFHKEHREMIVGDYLEHVFKEGKEMQLKNRRRKLFMNNSNNDKRCWSHIVFEHPATFESLAMDPPEKQAIIEDLLTFRESKDFYSRIGKAWKRGYLLYGPPGTGKSTMIAAMANLLNYDVYDLELTAVKDNAQLRRLLIDTTSKSIIVIEDIDCSLDLTGKRKNLEVPPSGGIVQTENPHNSTSSQVTLSGLLNSIDGLWSACGGERIIVFTTNHVEKLDSALTRRGRMDYHIKLSYCSFEGFKVIAKNYLEVETHPMFEEIEKLMKMAKITPADVAENLMPKSKTKDAEACFLNLIQQLKKKVEKKEAKSSASAKQVLPNCSE